MEYPPGYLGSQAKEDISPGEVIIHVPRNLMIMTLTAFDSEIGHMFQENNHLYTDAYVDYEDAIIITYLIYEKYKGVESKWYYFIQANSHSPDIL